MSSRQTSSPNSYPNSSPKWLPWIAATVLALVGTACKDDAPASDTDSEGTSTGEPPLMIDFLPSNIMLDQPYETVGDVFMAGDCQINGSGRGRMGCGVPTSDYVFFDSTQSDGSTIGVFVVRNWTIAEDAEIEVVGDSAMAFVALQTIVVEGRLFARPGEVGGAPGSDAAIEGFGEGAGTGIAGPVHGGGGAGYCGVGGDHGNGSGAGGSWGNESLVPLIGGSSGGETRSGRGGGGLQLVAGVSIDIIKTVTVPGGGGENGGGGSGGSLLIEAPNVKLSGRVAANGGGGASGDRVDGQIGQDRAAPAPGGLGMNDTPGGQGSFGDEIDGTQGTSSVMTDQEHGSGGGAAGRIRINTASGAGEITGAVSPTFATGCATQGTLG